jgi:hypothetical protein
MKSRCLRPYEWLAVGETAADVDSALIIARTCRVGGIRTTVQMWRKREQNTLDVLRRASEDEQSSFNISLRCNQVPLRKGVDLQ